MLAVTVAFGLAAIPAAVQTRRARRVADAAGQAQARSEAAPPSARSPASSGSSPSC
jgi:hypothetical protein